MMGKKEKNLVDYYCEMELNEFRDCDLFKEIEQLLKKTNANMKLECGKDPIMKKRDDVYISLSLWNSKNEMIEIFDDGFLSASSKIVMVDSKKRISLFDWTQDDELEDDLYRIVDYLKKI